MSETGTLNVLLLIAYQFHSVNIETSKEYVRFSVSGDSGSGNILLKPNNSGKGEEKVELEVEEPINLSFALR